MNRKRVWLITIGLLVCAAMVFAGGARQESDVVQLTFRQGDPPAEVQGLFAAIEEFNTSQNRIRVVVETVPWADALNQFVREGQAGGGPDVLQLAFVWTKDLGSSGLLKNLDNIVRQSPPGAGIDDFLGTDLGLYNDSLFGIPWTVDTFVMAYRPDLLQSAGVNRFPDTWEEFLETAVRLTDQGRGQYGFGFPAGSASGGGMWFLANYYLWSRDKFFVEPDGRGGWRVGVTEADVAEAMRYFNQFFERGASPRSLIGVNSWGDPELVGGLARGDFAISFFPPPTFRNAASQSSVPLGTAMIPRGPSRRVSHLGGRALAINENTQYPDEAWEFLNYLLSRGVFERYTNFPAQESLLGELEFGPGEQGYADQLPHAITFKQYIESPAPVSGMWDATNREFASVYSGQKTPEQAARDLIRSMQELL